MPTRARLVTMVFATLMLPSLVAAAEQKPNILVFLSDDVGWAEYGFQGSKDIPTPHIDSIAKGGVRFTRQSQKVTRNILQEGVDPRGRRYYWLHEQQVTDGVDPDSDYAAVLSGAISITPLQLEHTHATSLNHLSHWAKRLEKR